MNIEIVIPWPHNEDIASTMQMRRKVVTKNICLTVLVFSGVMETRLVKSVPGTLRLVALSS